MEVSTCPPLVGMSIGTAVMCRSQAGHDDVIVVVLSCDEGARAVEPDRTESRHRPHVPRIGRAARAGPRCPL